MEQSYDVIVIGGGATGTGVLRDLALRGIRAALVEKGDLASGTSGRFHGLLHSGCRYAVKDPESARECIRENQILRRIAPHAIDVQEGLFVQVEGDDPSFADRWVEACQKQGIAVQELGVGQALERDPSLHPKAARVFSVPDGSVDSWRLTQANVKAAQGRGADVYLWHRVTGIRQSNGRVTGLELADAFTGRKRTLGCRLLVNATGAWAGEIGRLAGINIPMALDKGTMIVFDHYFSPRVINRLRLPGDGDILVPVGSVSILGTSANKVDDPEDRTTDSAEVARLVRTGAEMVPGLKAARVLRTFVGVRPLYRPPQVGGRSSHAVGGQARPGGGQSPLGGGQRDISRGIVILDHEALEGLAGMVTVVGGKLTTYRLMAEQVVDVVAAKLGVSVTCTTAQVPLLEDAVAAASLLGPGAAEAAGTTPQAMDIRRARRLYSYLPAAEARALVHAGSGPLVCECEGVDQAELEVAARHLHHPDLADLRRRTRLGMGPCQGTMCSFRAAGLLHQVGIASAGETNHALVAFLSDRWRGTQHSPSLQQLRENEVTRGLYLGNLNLAALPGVAKCERVVPAAAGAAKGASR